jgi:hypothetical protein
MARSQCDTPLVSLKNQTQNWVPKLGSKTGFQNWVPNWVPNWVLDFYLKTRIGGSSRKKGKEEKSCPTLVNI